MKTVNTWVKKVTFEMQHPSSKEHRLVRTLAVSDTIYVPDGYPVPSNADLGFVSFDYRDDKDWPILRGLIMAEVIASKIDGLSPAAVSEVIRTVQESEIQILHTASERQNSGWHARFAIQVEMPGGVNTKQWYDPKAQKLIDYTRSSGSYIGDPYFYNYCVYVSNLVAASKAKQLLVDWERHGLAEMPVSTEVKEICYGKQEIQLTTEFVRDSLYGGQCAFTPYRAADGVAAVEKA